MALPKPQLNGDVLAYDEIQTDEINAVDTKYASIMKIYSGTLIDRGVTIQLDAPYHSGVILQAMVQHPTNGNWQSFPAVTAVTMNTNRSSATISVDGFYANRQVIIVVVKRSALG